MDVTRSTSPPSIRVQNFNGKQRSMSKSSLMPLARTREPMLIPNARGPPPPPPLPPPTDLNTLAAVDDPGWAFANLSGGAMFGNSRASLSSDSGVPRGWNIKTEEDDSGRPPDVMRRNSSAATVKSSLGLNTTHAFSMHHEGYHGLTGSNPPSYQLHGVRHLEPQNLHVSSQAYDNKLLSKIEKPHTTALRTPKTENVDASPSAGGLFFGQSGKHPHSFKSLSGSDISGQSSPDFSFRRESIPSRLGDSPQSRPMSPRRGSTTASPQHYMEHRSPTFDRSTPSSATEPDHLQRPFPSFHQSHPFRYPGNHPSTGGSGNLSNIFPNRDESAKVHPPSFLVQKTASNFTSSNTVSGRRRGSHDQSLITEADSATVGDFPMEETGNTATALRQLQLEDRTPLSSLDSLPSSSNFPFTHSSLSDSRFGMKRKASSPPPEAAHDDKAPSLLVGNSSELYHRDATSTSSTHHLSANHPLTQNRFAPSHGSLSSSSSVGLRNGSYASSNCLSVGSSITSMSSHDPLSPGGISPSSDHQQHNGRGSPYVTSLSMNSSPQSSLTRLPHPPPMESKSQAAIARRMSGGTAGPRNHPNAPNIQAHAHICECCPKKPKKFDTLEELKNHEAEKQYQCNYCHNRFKNKNEAERHQNSLHLRRHSWSCATLANAYDAAFHQAPMPPTTNPNDPSPQMNMIPPDICGYCGEQFPNDPAPDWEARMAHLTNVHKFGECNQSKKFFRADHFRQHLKHSHAGTSGKWTNMLENACIKDEPPLTGPGLENMLPQSAPVAHMGGMGPGPAHGMGMPGMGGLREERIDEMRD